MKLKTLSGCLSISPLIVAGLLMTAASPAKAQTVSLDAAAAASCAGGICPGLGNAFYLPDLNALSTNTGGVKIFLDTTIPQCATFKASARASRLLSSESSVDSLLRSVSTELALAGTYASRRMSVKASASRTTNSDFSRTTTFHSVRLDVTQVFSTVDLTQNSDCVGLGNLDPAFLRAFEALPLIDPQSVAESVSWDAYVQFLRTDGSHVMTQQLIGSRFQQWESSTSNESNIETKLRMRACAEVEGVEAGRPGWSVSGCAAFSRDERESSLRVVAQSQRVIRGGSDETRNGLLKEVSPETLNAFIDSGRLGDQPIGYQFTPVWNLLARVYRTQCGQSGPGSSACQNLQRARNLEAAYDGWLAVGCNAQSSGGFTYQEMRTTGSPNQLGIYSYQCWARRTGCEQNRDCRMGRGTSTCFCYGPSCFDAGALIEGTEENRTSVRGSRSGGTNQGVNQSCTYRFGATCGCNQSWRGGLADRSLYLQSSN
jgi:hypothetical protein